MPSFNKVVLLGNLTRDPQLKYLPSQTALCEFGMAINRKFSKDGEKKEEVCFVDLVTFGKQAETLNQYVKKGSGLLIEGRLKYESWEDKNGGGKRSKLVVIVENFQFMSSRSDGESDGGRPAKSRRGSDAIGAEKEFDEADIPF